MFRPLSLFIGLRYTGTRRRSELVSFISVISMLGLTVAVALLILVLSVMNGFDREMRTRILGLVPHITVQSFRASDDWSQVERTVLSHPDVTAIAPFVQLNAMLLRGLDVETVVLYGIDPDLEQQVSIIGQYLRKDTLSQMHGADQIVVGAPLAKKLGIERGGELTLLVPQDADSGRQRPVFKTLQVVDIFNTGTEIDQSVAMISMATASSLLPADALRRGLRVSVRNNFDAPGVAWEISQNLPFHYLTTNWTQTYGNLYSAIQLSRQLVVLMLLGIIAVAAFNVVSALVMVVTDKRGDIAILRTQGAGRRQIMAIFMVQGTLIGCIGTFFGALIGVLLSLSVTDVVAAIEQAFQVHFLDSDVYPVNYLPSDLRWMDVLMVSAVALGMSLLATVYPAWRAARVMPAEALRYE